MISIFGPESDPEDAEAAMEEMEGLVGASMLAIAIWNGDAVLATEYDLEQTESILRQMTEVVRMSRAH
jgi:hypothetical protein